MESLFENTPNLVDVDFSRWNVSNALNLHNTFRDSGITGMGLENWKVEKARHMKSMFQGAVNMDADLSQWNVSVVTTMANMFENSGFSGRGLETWSTGT